jgi:hypothetical protein
MWRDIMAGFICALARQCKNGNIISVSIRFSLFIYLQDEGMLPSNVASLQFTY